MASKMKLTKHFTGQYGYEKQGATVKGMTGTYDVSILLTRHDGKGWVIMLDYNQTGSLAIGYVKSESFATKKAAEDALKQFVGNAIRSQHGMGERTYVVC